MLRPLACALAVALLPHSAEAQTAKQRSGATIVVGGNRDYPPYEFLDAQGQPAGYNVDLTLAIAEAMGMKVEIRLGSWAELRGALQDGRVDALQGMSHSEARSEEVAFAPPHAQINHAIFARRGTTPVGSLEGLRGKKVVVHRAGIMDDQLTRLGYGDDLVRVASPGDALRRLAKGDGEYAVVALLPGITVIQEEKLDLVPVARDVASHRYGYAVRRNDAVLLSRLTEGLAILKGTGQYDAINQRWLGVLEPPRPPAWGEFFKYGAVVFVPLLLVLGGTVVWSRSLQREVAQRTASLAREVTERQRAVEELRLNQAQLVQADKMAALGVLVSGVAHEINNPNGYILLNMPVLKDVYLDALEHLEERYREKGEFMLGGLRYSEMRQEIPAMLDEMLEGARRIKRIVEDLKDFARPEDAPRLEPLDFNAVTQAAIRLVDNSIKKATHHFTLSCGERLPRVRGNAQRIEQVIVNLVLNACQALPDPTRAIRVSTRAEGGRVLLTVEDEGVGIPPENLPRLTDPFFTTKRDSGGTGLGLSVSSGIVKEHGGSLEFRSAAGAGTTVQLGLPAAEGGA